MKKFTLAILLFLFVNVGLAQKLSLDQLRIPSGFSISVYGDRVKNARELALGNHSIVFVGSSRAGKVYALLPEKNNANRSKVLVIASGLDEPTGVAFYQNDLYVAEINRILCFTDVEKHLQKPLPPRVIFNNFPKIHTDLIKGIYPIHTWKVISFSKDGWLYVAVGSPCNNCLAPDPRFGTILRMKPDGSYSEIYAKGIRNSVGFDWHPITHELWFTDNGRDWMGDNMPPDKLNHAPVKGLDFGFPYYHGLDNQGQPIADPEFSKLRPPKGITWQALSLPAHVAALGMTFYTGESFPLPYQNQLFIAEHGSWNRSQKIGYQVTLVTFKNNKPLSYTPFITGWEKNEKVWGRPVDILTMPDGSLLISDDFAGVVYRVTYKS